MNDDGVSSEQIERCDTCYFWEHLQGKRCCRKNRIVKIGKVKVTGTPADYWCGKYSPLNVATCSECIYWNDENRPRKKAPCSQLRLIDEAGRKRSKQSLYCDVFEPEDPIEFETNYTLRIDEQLASVYRLIRHSKPLAMIIRSSDEAGLLVIWKPEGPGAGVWEVLPVDINEEEGDFRLRQFISNPDLQEGKGPKQREIAFAGNATLHHDFGSKFPRKLLDTYEGQHSRTWTQLREIWRQKNWRLQMGLRKITFRVKALMTRPNTTITVGNDIKVETSPESNVKIPDRIQDEPWGSNWPNLKEQVDNMIEVGHSIQASVIAVQRRYFSEYGGIKRNLTSDDAKRLQRQLMAVFNSLK